MRDNQAEDAGALRREASRARELGFAGGALSPNRKPHTLPKQPWAGNPFDSLLASARMRLARPGRGSESDGTIL